MEYSGSIEIVADRERVWEFLADPTRFGPCSPVPIERVDDRHYRARAKLGGGFFATTIAVELEITDLVDREMARMAGRGGASGTTVEGTSTFRLGDGALGGTTVVDWSVEFRLKGMLAGAASRVIDERAPQAIDQLLNCVRQQIER